MKHNSGKFVNTRNKGRWVVIGSGQIIGAACRSSSWHRDPGVGLDPSQLALKCLIFFIFFLKILNKKSRSLLTCSSTFKQILRISWFQLPTTMPSAIHSLLPPQIDCRSQWLVVQKLQENYNLNTLEASFQSLEPKYKVGFCKITR